MKTKQRFEEWNRRIHIVLGLYLLLFIWLFSLTGLIMNHPKWFGYSVDRSPSEQTIDFPNFEDPSEIAESIRSTLGFKGEILLRQQRSEETFNFMILRPNKRFAINVDRQTGIAKINEVTPQPNVALGDLHTFTGVRGMWNEPVKKRDWIVTRLWSFSIDAICVGTIVIVATSIYMGLTRKGERLVASIALGLGSLLCALFIWGLAAMS